MRIIERPARSSWAEIARRPVADLADIRETVSPILAAVREQGDTAVREFTRKFDGIEISGLRVPEQELATAEEQVPAELRDAILLAFDNIRTFHESQADPVRRIETSGGVSCWRRSVPIDNVGLYIPGGSAPLFSTVLMLAVPAALAGCPRVVLCSPPGSNGRIHPAVLFAAAVCGVREVYRIGGAQAIGAMAFGTASIGRVDKIFGPGNQYVTAAKQLVQQEGVSIDMPAGPSEVAVIADNTADAAAVAADLLAQAEHGPDSQVLLLTDDAAFAGSVLEAVREQLKDLPRREMADRSMENSSAIVFSSLDEAVEFSNLYAPEHLIINAQGYRELSDKVRNAGSVFLGPWTPESLGDYASGTNHTLPTNGHARAYSGVSLDSFVKKITFQEASREGLRNIGGSVAILAEHEQLDGHKRAVTIRLKT